MKLFKFLFGISACLFLSICAGVSAKNHSSPEAYFEYIDAQHKPRTLIVGCGECTAKDKDYFCLDICEEVNADFTCDIATKNQNTIAKLGIGQWDYIVFEHVPVKEAQARGGIINALHLLKNGGTISSHTYPVFPSEQKTYSQLRAYGLNKMAFIYLTQHVPNAYNSKIANTNKDPTFRNEFLKKLGIPPCWLDTVHSHFEHNLTTTNYDPRNENNNLINWMLLITRKTLPSKG